MLLLISARQNYAKFESAKLYAQNQIVSYFSSGSNGYALVLNGNRFKLLSWATFYSNSSARFVLENGYIWCEDLQAQRAYVLSPFMSHQVLGPDFRLGDWPSPVYKQNKVIVAGVHYWKAFQERNGEWQYIRLARLPTSKYIDYYTLSNASSDGTFVCGMAREYLNQDVILHFPYVQNVRTGQLFVTPIYKKYLKDMRANLPANNEYLTYPESDNPMTISRDDSLLYVFPGSDGEGEPMPTAFRMDRRTSTLIAEDFPPIRAADGNHSRFSNGKVGHYWVNGKDNYLSTRSDVFRPYDEFHDKYGAGLLASYGPQKFILREGDDHQLFAYPLISPTVSTLDYYSPSVFNSKYRLMIFYYSKDHVHEILDIYQLRKGALVKIAQKSFPLPNHPPKFSSVYAVPADGSYDLP